MSAFSTLFYFFQQPRKIRQCQTTIDFIKAKGSQFRNGDDSAQYLVVTNITPESVKELERIRSGERNLPRMKLTYFAGENTLIIKLAGKVHEQLSRLFHDNFHRICADYGITLFMLKAHGGGNCEMPRDVQKEPDESYSPDTRSREDFPSFVVEIGASESLDHLRLDARLWLSNTNGWTCLVLLIKIDQDAKTLTFERWERIRQPSQQPGTHARSQTEIVPGRVEEVVVNFSNPSNITVRGAPMLLPINLIFDNVHPLPQGVNADRLFSISANVFRSIAAEFADL
ncbi:hypothetical protein BJX96DRAFT_176479 [Aspergillus floccosus]